LAKSMILVGRLFGLTLAFALPLRAAAGMLASPMLAGLNADSGQLLRCAVTNVGKRPVSIHEASIYHVVSGAVVSLQSDSCTGRTLAPQDTCQFITIEGVPGAFGRVSFSGNAKRLRGNCQVFSTGDLTIRAEGEMR
jgi:hypothetical protein